MTDTANAARASITHSLPIFHPWPLDRALPKEVVSRERDYELGKLVVDIQ
jgi:hypothetical protein